MESDIRCKLPMKKKNRNKKRRNDQLTDLSPDGSSSTEQSPVFLDVVCGHNRAKLSLDRLGRGTKTACVLVDDAWMTPNQYQHVSGRGTARDWKRSIKHNGTSLKALLSNKTLCLNPPSCRCNLCNPTSPKDEKVGVDDVKEADQENLPPGSNNQTSETGCNKSGQETAATDKQQQHQQQQLQQQLQQQQQQQQQGQQQQPQQQQQQQQQLQHEDESQPQPLVPHPPKSASLGGDVENWTRKRKLMSALALQATSAGKKRILEYKEWRRMRKEKRLNTGSDEGTALKKIKMDELPGMESKCSPGKEVAEETLTSPSRSSLVPTCEDKMASGSFGEISLDERNLSMVKEATMLHIVTELRNYRKSLEERIDASRRCSANLFSNEQTIVVGDNRQSVIQSHRKERTLTTKNSRRSTDENPLPDLVRSHNPSNTSVLQASPCAIPAGKISLVTSGIKLPIPSPIDARPPSKLSPKTINRQFSVDQYGVLDLSTKSHDASPGYSYARDYHCQSNLANYFLGGDDSEGEQVLDLSKNSSVSVTPPSSRTTGVQLPSFGAAKSILRPPTGSRPKKTRTRKRCPTNLDRMLKWSVNDVAKFASGITGCEEYSEILTKFGVTGASLPLLTVDHMIGTLRMRQTAAHSFRLAIDRLVMS